MITWVGGCFTIKHCLSTEELLVDCLVTDLITCCRHPSFFQTDKSKMTKLLYKWETERHPD